MIGMFTDVFLAALPIPFVIKLQLNPRTKFALNTVLALGLIAVGAGAIKVHAQLTFIADKDRLFHDRFFVWAAMELYLGITAASLPTLKPLMAKFLSKALSTLIGSSANEISSKPQSAQPPRPSKYTKYCARKRDSLLSYGVRNESSKNLTQPLPSKPETSFSFYNGIMRRSSVDVHTECTRSGAIEMGRVTWSEVPPPMPSQGDFDEKNKDQCIVRTTMVTTTSEARNVMDNLDLFGPGSQTSVEAPIKARRRDDD